jgi:predicted porin
MKTYLTVAALSATAALSNGACAQSSVTLFGVVDLGLRHVRNGDASVTSLASSGNNTSRFGLRGTEDLGDGLKAGFWLESGLNPDNGTTGDGTRFWNRRSTVSLLGAFGELRIGRDYTPSYLGYEDYDVWSDIGLESVNKFDSALGTARDTGIRADNQVAYLTPALGGFYSRLAVAPGEGIAGKKYWGGRFGYAAGPLDVSLSHGRTQIAPVLGDDRFTTTSGGVAYDFGPVKLSGYRSQSRIESGRVTNTYIGGQIPIGRGMVRASYIRSDQSGRNAAGASIDANDAHQVALGVLYNLSQRTAFYSNVVRVSNASGSSVAVDRNPAPAAGRDSTGVDLGVRHSF